MKTLKKILIMELWGIGDVVMMSAVLKPLHEAFPQAEICVLSQRHGQEILRENKEVSRFFVFKFPWTAFRGKYNFVKWDWKGLLAIITSLRREKFDLILDARGDPRNILLSFFIGGRHVGAKKTAGSRHRVEHWGQVLGLLGVPATALRPSIELSIEERAEAANFVRERFEGRPPVLVGIHPGAGQKIRCWPLTRFREIANRLLARHIGVVVLSEQEGYGNEMARDLGLPPCQSGLRQLAALISELDLLVCNDTGVMHIAGAVGTPVVAVFGPGDPAFIGPRRDAEVVIKDCPDRPCFDNCRRVIPECLEEVTVEDVWAAVLRSIDRLKGDK